MFQVKIRKLIQIFTYEWIFYCQISSKIFMILAATKYKGFFLTFPIYRLLTAPKKHQTIPMFIMVKLNENENTHAF